jgi:hypothetical protein
MECPQCIKKKKKELYNNDEQWILFMHINSSNKDFLKWHKKKSRAPMKSDESCVCRQLSKKAQRERGEKSGMKLTFIQMFLFFILFLLIAPCQIYSEFFSSPLFLSSSSSLSTKRVAMIWLFHSPSNISRAASAQWTMDPFSLSWKIVRCERP